VPVVLAQGDLAQAIACFVESLTLSWEESNLRDIAYCLEGLAGVASAQARPERAARLFGAAAALRELINHPLPPVSRSDYERDVAAARALIDEQFFEAAWAKGRALTLEQAIADGLDTHV
jgi:hypothetical protein